MHLVCRRTGSGGRNDDRPGLASSGRHALRVSSDPVFSRPASSTAAPSACPSPIRPRDVFTTHLPPHVIALSLTRSPSCQSGTPERAVRNKRVRAEAAVQLGDLGVRDLFHLLIVQHQRRCDGQRCDRPVGFVLRDGHVIGATEIGVRSGLSARVERVEVRSACNLGILAGKWSRIHANRVTSSGSRWHHPRDQIAGRGLRRHQRVGLCIMIAARVVQGKRRAPERGSRHRHHRASLVANSVPATKGGVGLSTSFDTGYGGNVCSNNDTTCP